MFPTSKLAVLPATLLVCICFFVAGERTRAEPKPAEVPLPAIYHPDREHLWNRIHAAFQIRIGPDGRSYGEDRLEPLLWYRSKYLLEGAPAERAEAVLEEFLRDKGESLIDDPVKRAVFQRDLWLVSNWLASQHNDDARKRLEPLLTKVIRKLALEAIDKMAARTGTGGQVFAEFQLRRTELFGGKAGGLRDVSEERDFKTGFNTHGFDEFEQPPSNDRPFPERAYPFANNRTSCVACHSAPGVYGFNSIPFFAFGLPSRFDFDAKDWGRLKSALLAEMKPDAVEKAAIMWKEQQPGWITLRELLSE